MTTCQHSVPTTISQLPMTTWPRTAGTGYPAQSQYRRQLRLISRSVTIQHGDTMTVRRCQCTQGSRAVSGSIKRRRRSAHADDAPCTSASSRRDPTVAAISSLVRTAGVEARSVQRSSLPLRKQLAVVVPSSSGIDIRFCIKNKIVCFSFQTSNVAN